MIFLFYRDKKKNMGQLFFDEKSIFDISKPNLKFVMDRRTDARMDEQAESNMPLQVFQSSGHNN